MAIESVIQADHIPNSNYELIVLGLPVIHFISIDGIEEKLETVITPDRRRHSTGYGVPFEFRARSMMHHTIERAALEVWYKEGVGDVTATYKRPGTLIFKRASGQIENILPLMDMFITGRKMPSLNMTDDNAAVIEWTFSATTDLTTAGGALA